jgi:hypothetical protein
VEELLLKKSSSKVVTHIARCTHAVTVALWEQSLEKLAAWFSHDETHPGITQLLLARLNTWSCHQETQFPIPRIPALHMAYLDQQEIGWFNFLQGHISNHWAKIQSEYYRLLESHQTGNTWARQLISHLWDITWKMWLHCNYILHEMPKF